MIGIIIGDSNITRLEVSGSFYTRAYPGATINNILDEVLADDSLRSQLQTVAKCKGSGNAELRELCI